jgi:hypothetical protein
VYNPDIISGSKWQFSTLAVGLNLVDRTNNPFGLAAPVIVLVPNDIVLTEITTGLNFDQI